MTFSRISSMTEINSSHRFFNVGNYLRDNRMGGETLMERNCLINQNKFLLCLFYFNYLLKRVAKGNVIKAKINVIMEFLQKLELDSSIYEPARGVICLL